jgi:hypothetical protein
MGATIIFGHCPIQDRHHNIGDPTIVDAICFRLLHKPTKIEFRGDSMRIGTRQTIGKPTKNKLLEVTAN